MQQDLPTADELLVVFARMSGLLLSRETVDTAIGLVTSLATDTLPHTIGSGITLVEADGSPSTTGASNQVVGSADALQYELGEGPCLQAWRERVLVRIDDLAGDGRWSRWAAAVEPLGLRSSLSAPLVAGNVALGALKVYSVQAAAYDERSEHLVTLFAAQAAILLANIQSVDAGTQLSDALRGALQSRDEISTAKGIVMARDGVDKDTALAVLVALSRRENRPLRDVAHTLVRSAVRHRR